MGKPTYSEHLETLAAVITHLALYKRPKRTVHGIATESQIGEQAVQFVLDNFGGIFKKYLAKSPSGEALYALHVRHARQSAVDGDDAELEPLDPQYLTILLEFVSHRAQDESQRRTSYIVAWIGAAVSVIAAAVALIGTG